jgi:hypothetical protein
VSEHGFSIDRLAAMHHELCGKPRTDCARKKGPASAAAPEAGEKPVYPPQADLFESERDE